MRPCAVFDLDGTISAGSSERTFARYLFERGEISLKDLLRWSLTALKELPLKREIAYKSNRIYLKGKEYHRIRDLAARCFEEHTVKRISKKAVEKINFHKDRKDEVIILSGTLSLIVEDFKAYLKADIAIASDLEVEKGIITGQTDGIQPYAAAKAFLARKLAEDRSYDLKRSYSYGNHHTDANVLRIVGNPVAVNPNRKLALIAKREGWKVEIFD